MGQALLRLQLQQTPAQLHGSTVRAAQDYLQNDVQGACLAAAGAGCRRLAARCLMQGDRSVNVDWTIQSTVNTSQGAGRHFRHGHASDHAGFAAASWQVGTMGMKLSARLPRVLTAHLALQVAQKVRQRGAIGSGGGATRRKLVKPANAMMVS